MLLWRDRHPCGVNVADDIGNNAGLRSDTADNVVGYMSRHDTHPAPDSAVTLEFVIHNAYQINVWVNIGHAGCKFKTTTQNYVFIGIDREMMPACR
jgi:hypothetical protein